MRKNSKKVIEDGIARSEQEEQRLHMYEPFTMMSICRADLEGYVDTPSAVTNEQMFEIADKLGEALMEFFWDDLSIVADYVMKGGKE